jgi:hypothetical protein
MLTKEQYQDITEREIICRIITEELDDDDGFVEDVQNRLLWYEDGLFYNRPTEEEIRLAEQYEIVNGCYLLLLNSTQPNSIGSSGETEQLLTSLGLNADTTT